MNGPWYNTTMFSLWHGLSFEGYVTTSIRDRYNLMCSIEANDRYYPTINYDAISGGGKTSPYNPTKDTLVSFGIKLIFIEKWIK